MGSKPSVAGFGAATAPRRMGKGRVRVTTDMPETIANTLYYQLMVAYEATEGVGKKCILDDMWKITSEGFGDYMDARARSRPAELQHVYEWNQNGDPKGRLFKLVRVGQNDQGFAIAYRFLASRKVAPIAEELRRPGPSGKVVSKSSVFRNKAEVIESGQSVMIRRKSARFLAIPASRIRGASRNTLGIYFSRGPVKIDQPGGPMAVGGFERAFRAYYGSGLATKHLKSRGFFDKTPRVIRMAAESVPMSVHGHPGQNSLDGAAQLAVKRANGV